MDIRTRLYFAGTLALLLAPMPAAAQLNVLCPMAAEWCSLAATEFEKETGIKASMTLKGSGESFAQIAAEKANPKLDIWFGGTGDPHLQAAELDLTMPYKSPMLDQLQPWARKQAEQSGYKTVGTLPRRARHRLQHRAAREEETARRRRAGRTSSSRFTPATCRWPIRMRRAPRTRPSRPWSRCSARTTRSSCLKDMHKNINNYSRQGVGPIKATARGENMVAVAFIHDVVTEAQARLPGEERRALRRHRLRDRLDVDRQGCAQPRQREASSTTGR